MLPESDEEDSISGDESDSDGEAEAVPEGAEIQLDDKTAKKLQGKLNKLDARGGDDDAKDRGVIYLGHIPFGFFEEEMRGFFSQFGQVTRLRLSRSKKTGNSRGYAFIEFADAGVAEVVADTMDKYLLFGRILACRVVPHEELHPQVFKNCEKKFVKMPVKKMARDRHNAPKTAAQQKRQSKTLLSKEKKKRAKLAELGIDYEFPGYAAVTHDAPSKIKFDA